MLVVGTVGGVFGVLLAIAALAFVVTHVVR